MLKRMMYLQLELAFFFFVVMDVNGNSIDSSLVVSVLMTLW